MKKTLVFLLCLIPFAVRAQQDDIQGDNAGKQSLFRGIAAPQYLSKHNGTPLWDNGGLSRGDVYFDGRLYRDVLLDVNSALQQLYVTTGAGNAVIMPERDLVAWFTRNGKLYLNLRYMGVKDVPEGFYEQYSDTKGKKWYRQVTKCYLDAIGDFNDEGGIGYVDPHYKSDCLHYFQIVDRYYTISRKGSYEKYKRRRALRAGLKIDNTIPEMPHSYAASRMVEDRGRGITFSAEGIQHLPAGYFSEKKLSESQLQMQEYINQDNIIAQTRNKTYIIGSRGKTSDDAIVSGTVRDVASGEPLQGVLVSDRTGRIFTYTDKNGFYKLQLPLGENVVNLSDYSKEDMHINVVVCSSGGLDLVMRDEVKQLQSAYVSAETRAEHRRAAMGLEKITSGVISKIPSAFGEGDVLKAVLTLPGVKTVGEAGSGFNVRGGSADQNLILFNEGTVYNPSHMFGIFSAFNPDVVDGVELYKSSIPVRYGGRISSVLDVRSKDGARDRVHGSLGIGILTSHAMIEGPIGKKTTFVLGGRTTYSNWMLNLLPKSSGYSGGKANFFDLNASLTHRFDENNKLQVYGYYSYDKFGFSSDTTFRYSNINASARYTHKSTGGTTIVVSGGFDQYSNTLEDGVKAQSYNSYSLSTTIRQGYARVNFTTPVGSHSFNYGGDAVYYSLRPGDMTPPEGSSVVEAHLDRQEGIEPAIYAGGVWTAMEGLFSLDYGVRFSSFLALRPSKFYCSPEARISGKYSPNPNLSIKAGFNTMNQYIHLISNTAGISPMDTWQLCSERIKPQRGWQAAGGVYWTVAKGQLDLSLEGYYKRVNNYLDYKSGAVLQMNPDLADDLVDTRCKAYGVEVMAKKSTGKLTGWISYTYSRALLQETLDRSVSTINGGDWYRAAHDKPHDVKLVCNYAFTHRYSASINLDYSTGRPVTIPTGQYYYDGALHLQYSERNGYRIPDYFRMDVAFNIEPGHYLKAFTHASCTIGCYNVTGRRNAYSVYYNTSGGKSLKGYMVSVFATQMPYITINLKF